MRTAKYKKQKALLESAITAKEARKRKHDPLVLLQPWSILRDEFFLSYYPEGLFQKPTKYGPLTYEGACDLLRTYPENLICQFSMGECMEWLFVFHHFSDHARLYTEDQHDRLIQKELQEYPELAYLMTDEGGELLEILLRLPQCGFVKMADFQKAIGGK